ncbi:hypothetical protein AGMMS49975_12440 [Clostridia bacterium]|nr:hypothetical protein AGMMS49975_12440 [Clostridia bacterium]
MKSKIMSNVSKTVYKVGFQLRKYSPEILAVVGVVGIVAGTVMACKATTKASEVLEDMKEDISKINDCAENEELQESNKYTEEDRQKDKIIVYTKTTVKLAKIYAPAVAIGIFSVGSLLMSNRILRKRNIAFAAAYTAVDKGFKEYRKRVAERFGENVEREIKYNISEDIAINENGSETTKPVANIAYDSSVYARFFDASSGHYEKDPEYNLMFLKAQQNHANDLLKARGYLFLNEVYQMLDIPITKAGQVVGWLYDAKNPSGDNYVDFGIFNLGTNCDFVNGYETVILLDFNVDGNIWNKDFTSVK